jgi:hypothetical protein
VTPVTCRELTLCNAAAQMNLKTRGRDHGTHPVMTPLEFIQRLAEQALIRRRLLPPRARDWFLPSNSD